MEIEYFYWDVLPIGISLIAGIICLLILCFVNSTCFQNFGNRLIPWLCGGKLIEVNGANDQLQNAVRNRNCIKRVLMVNVVTLAILLLMSFCDTVIIRSDYGCTDNIECYIEHNNYNETPLDCSDTLNEDKNIVCYQLKFDFFQAFADMGGILTVATLGVYFLLICCDKTNPVRKIRPLWLNGLKIVFVLVTSAIFWCLFVIMNMYNRRQNTIFRFAGYILKYIAVDISFSITILTPWYKLIRQNVNTPAANNPVVNDLVVNGLVVNGPVANNPVNKPACDKRPCGKQPGEQACM